MLYVDFLHFFHDIHFLCQGPTQDTTFYSVICFLRLLLVMTVSQTPLVFD